MFNLSKNLANNVLCYMSCEWSREFTLKLSEPGVADIGYVVLVVYIA